MDLAEPFAETLVPRRERSLIDRRLLAIASFACVVGHAIDTRDRSGKIATAPPPKAARTILSADYRVKNSASMDKSLKRPRKSSCDRIVQASLGCLAGSGAADSLTKVRDDGLLRSHPLPARAAALKTHPGRRPAKGDRS
jgi:hypothetical protein